MVTDSAFPNPFSLACGDLVDLHPDENGDLYVTGVMTTARHGPPISASSPIGVRTTTAVTYQATLPCPRAAYHCSRDHSRQWFENAGGQVETDVAQSITTNGRDAATEASRM